VEKYDIRYKKDYWPAVIGILLILSQLWVYAIGEFEKDILFHLKVYALIKLIFCFWAENILKKLNRSNNKWLILISCYLLTGITLVIISTLRKVRDGYYVTINMDESLKVEYDNNLKLLEKSFFDKLLSEKQFHNALNDLEIKYSKLNSEMIKRKEKDNIEILVRQLEELKNKKLISEEDYISKLTELTNGNN
jgi:hypothetical protein